MNAIIQACSRPKLVVAENVSVISLDRDRKRVVFNFANPIHVFGKWTPDYHYFSYGTQEEAEEAYELIKESSFADLFFIPKKAQGDIVAKNAITTINFRREDLRLIFNLKFSVTSYKDDKPVEIGKFVFWDFKTTADYDYELEELFKHYKITHI